MTSQTFILEPGTYRSVVDVVGLSSITVNIWDASPDVPVDGGLVTVPMSLDSILVRQSLLTMFFRWTGGGSIPLSSLWRTNGTATLTLLSTGTSITLRASATSGGLFGGTDFGWRDGSVIPFRQAIGQSDKRLQLVLDDGAAPPPPPISRYLGSQGINDSYLGTQLIRERRLG